MKLIVKIDNKNDLKLFESLFKNYIQRAEVTIDKKPVEIVKGQYKIADKVTITNIYSFDVHDDKLLFVSLLLKHLDKNGVKYSYRLED